MIGLRETTTRTSVDELEALWALPAAERARPDVRDRAFPLGKLLALAWPTLLVALMAFEPAPADENAPIPLWEDLVFGGFFLALVAAAVAGWRRHGRFAYAASAVAGVFGIAIAVACRATEYHLGAWWLAELAAFAALAALSMAGLWSRRGRASSPSP